MPTAVLSEPNSLKAEILYALLTRLFITEQDFRMNSFRSRVSDLRTKHKLTIRHKDVTKKNRYGHAMTYRRHYIWMKDAKKALRIYKTINDAKVHG